MDLRDCQRLASLDVQTWLAPRGPLEVLTRLMERCTGLAGVLQALEQNGAGSRGGPRDPLDQLGAELSGALTELACLANSYGLDLAEQMEEARRGFFARHPHLADAEQPPAVPARVERVTVYAASSPAAPASYLAASEELGRLLALQGWTVVYGGGDLGLMGALNRGVRAQNGRILGVILDRFVTRQLLSEGEIPDTKTVSSMRSRKRGLEENADAFICLPGGLGTLEELFETLSFRHLGFHYKPIVLCNVEGFWDELLRQLERCFADRLIPESSRSALLMARSPAETVELLRAWQPPPVTAPSWAAELRRARP